LKSQYLYLLINLLCILVPLLASFYSKAPFYKKWKDVGIAILFPAMLFIVWDEIFTRMGIWGFNSQYVSGWSIGSLPIEEILFFICIPYACIFTYFAVRYFIQNEYFFSNHELLSFAIIIGLLVAGIYNIDKPYTAVTFISLSFFLAYLTLKIRARFVGHFYAAFGIILIPFFIVNGILTGSLIEEEVVWYNDAANLGIRLGTIPLEDAFYAMLLLLMNVSLYEWRQSKA
jgi:lycopene cyclase domain-containing protein